MKIVSLIAISLFSILIMIVSSQVFAQDSAAQRMKELEERLQAMQSGMQTLQNELQKLRSESTQATKKIEDIEQKEAIRKIEHAQQREAREITVEEGKKVNMVFFRGGFAHSSQHRNGLAGR